jgi:NhaP-type Na+/H+ or K+/H+ antiporter
VTRDVILTLSLLLGAGMTARLLASVTGIPEVLVLVLLGASLGPHALDVVDVPLDTIGAQLLFTLGVSTILFHGGLNLAQSPPRRRVQPRHARDPGCRPQRRDHGGGRALRVRAAVV